MKKLMAIACLVIAFSGIAALFWYNELIYQLPTPVPENYKAVKTGEQIAVPAQLVTDPAKPVFLHFFNPDCPCSRFNMEHFRSLVNQFGERINFAIVVMNNDRYTARQIQKKFGLNLPVSFDSTLAASCGVYSTPQAAIVNTNHQLYYRGNYNKSRYCTDKKSNYAQIALEGLLHNNKNISFDRYALTAYGCRLPKCTKN